MCYMALITLITFERKDRKMSGSQAFDKAHDGTDGIHLSAVVHRAAEGLSGEIKLVYLIHQQISGHVVFLNDKGEALGLK